jgi:DNA mismatch repair protein MutH
MQHNSPPQSLAQLRSRADELAHRTIGELASILQIPLPDKLGHHKGLIGQMLEAILGTDAGNDSVPDFTQLGIELKTLPLSPSLQPKESTYVCTVPLGQLQNVTWDNSAVKAKLSHVLWIPILVLPNAPISARQILQPFFWQPSVAQAEVLENDFNELMDLIALGDLSLITASLGTYLHIRPKAANSSCLTPYEDEKTLPRGFYLRSTFTRGLAILRDFV